MSSICREQPNAMPRIHHSRDEKLLAIQRAHEALVGANSIPDIKSIRDKAEGVRRYAQMAHLGLDIFNAASELKLRAERKAGIFLLELCLRGGDRRSKDHENRLCLESLGISRQESRRWQLQAKIPESVFSAYLTTTMDLSETITYAGLCRFARTEKSTKAPSHHKRNSPPANLSDDRSNVPRPPNSSRILELLDEAESHLSTIASIGGPVSESDDSREHGSQARAFRRYVRELQNTLASIRDAVEQLLQ
jgi:hypothetical protein